MNLIILQKTDKIKEDLYQISDERFTHIKTILKSDINDIINIGILNETKGKAKITLIDDCKVELKIVSLEEQEKKSKIDIICALPRPQTLKKVLSTCATMGVNNLYLIRSEKVEKSYFHSPLLEEKNYTKFLIEGLSQGKRTQLPIVTIHNRFKRFFAEEFSTKNSICLLAHPDEQNYLSSEMLSSNKNIVLAIGPEGGWNDFEIDFMIEKGFTKFKLSENILRVETALTAALAQVELCLNK